VSNWLSRHFHREPSTPPEWASALGETAVKTARAQARLGVQVEELERKLEAGLEEVRSMLALKASRSAALAAELRREEQGSPGLWDDLLDAMDLLEEARRLCASEGQTETASGLGGVLARLERFLGRSGLERIAASPEPLDGRLFRVVGQASRPDLPPGAVVQVVRAAARCRDGKLIREGEVLVNGRSEEVAG
jgi:molecular chaperone GrpE (heat shock protein)